jgi:hypothetical protein
MRSNRTERIDVKARRLKSLGGAALVALALATTMASAAHAAQFMSDGNVEAKVEANQSTTHTFSVEGNNSTCGTAKFATAGLFNSPRSSVVLHPTYSGCTAFGFINVVISTTGCDLVFTAPGTVVAGKVPGGLEIVCDPGKAITVTAGTCEVSIGPQSFTKGLTFENNSAVFPRTVTLHSAVTGIEVTKVKDGFLCPLSGTGPVKGTYTGDTLAKAFSAEAEQVGITLE